MCSLVIRLDGADEDEDYFTYVLTLRRRDLGTSKIADNVKKESVR